jgi:hypothetical protein
VVGLLELFYLRVYSIVTAPFDKNGTNNGNAESNAGKGRRQPSKSRSREQMLAEIRTVRKAGREELKGMMKATQERIGANTKSMREEIKSGEAEMKSTVNAFQEKMNAAIANRNNDRKETTACHDEMEASINKIEPNSGEKEAVAERQEIPNKEVAVHSLRACQARQQPPEKRRRLSPIQV